MTSIELEQSFFLRGVTAYFKKDGDCLVCISHKPTVYGYFRAVYKGATVPLHRLSYMFNRGEIPEGLLIRHLCNNNRQDWVDAGSSMAWPLRNHSAALRRAEVLEIFHSSGGRGYQLRLAERYGISQSCVSELRAGKTYKDITTGLTRGVR